MNKTGLSRLFFPLYIFIFSSIFSQVDTVKNYNLTEITVQSGVLVEAKPLSVISYKQLSGLNSFSLNNIFFSLPSIKVQNNSRGESLVYFRGSGKRQLTLFFDGVPINIPWDNRIDLSLVPTNALESIKITKGIPSVVYGANSIAGVVNISSLKFKNKPKANFNIQLGENNYQNFSGFWNDNIGKLKYLLSFSYFNTDGFYLPYNSEDKRRLRTNSSSNSINGLLKLNYDYGHNSSSSVLFSLNDSEKDVPPENDVSSPRYWKYPVWQRLSTIINGTHKFINGSNISYSFSATKFNSQINQYKTEKYAEIDDIEKGEDLSFYGKLLYTSTITPNSIFKFVASGLSSEHNEQIQSSDFKSVVYAQNIYSSGIEYEYIKNNLSAIFGLSIDGQSTPQTGEQPAKDMVLDFGTNITFSYQILDNINSQISFGRKTRFPTLRELFSGALGRFILNPNLKAESAYSTELNFNAEIAQTKNQLNFFISYIKDGITRISLPERKFMRINKTQIRNYGMEFTNDINITKKLYTSLSFAYLNSFAENNKGEFVDTLEYKPKFIFNGKLNYLFTSNLETQLEANYIGEEFGLKEGSVGFQKLEDYLIINFKISYILNCYNKTKLKMYFRVNNILDKLYYTQWSLPEAGRQFFIGTTLTF
jgi:iron complex outermembrane receptor protein